MIPIPISRGGLQGCQEGRGGWPPSLRKKVRFLAPEEGGTPSSHRSTSLTRSQTVTPMLKTHQVHPSKTGWKTLELQHAESVQRIRDLSGNKTTARRTDLKCITWTFSHQSRHKSYGLGTILPLNYRDSGEMPETQDMAYMQRFFTTLQADTWNCGGANWFVSSSRSSFPNTKYLFHAITLVVPLTPSDVRHLGSSSLLIGVIIPMAYCLRKSEGLTSRNERSWGRDLVLQISEQVLIQPLERIVTSLVRAPLLRIISINLYMRLAHCLL
ncbi:uncharacterized protein BT62DRAFT_1076522 [Guyanagaster necrorhizus]|uniref:Uncharacterized protein n=1 Tax=Guyanagaster necrorhizus TaxID=856835 RepID=A0A9P7VSQ8_9AGAR|nr:uncharacterized protein BT62DRAFT_1076522 [Guyanagaster necrorhizus MCA 3950]KAG7446132.1 hypothetical protein BT62DRAFT_1076522 [Guyanagaster necrorhizus MCA 3950]